MQRIVVGVDGSEPARRALEWAIDEAKLRRAHLVVVHAWHQPTAAMSAPYVAAIDEPEAFEAEAKRSLEEALVGVDLSGLPDEAERLVLQGSPAEVLHVAASDADLVVVGSHGRGGIVSLLLGSVSQQVTHIASCPVVVVRAT